MFQLYLFQFVLFGGTLAGPFPVAPVDEPYHNQVALCAAMRPDGSFAVVWIDSLKILAHEENKIFIRFYDKEGAPLTAAQKITRHLPDTTRVHFPPSLAMDSMGNAALLWTETDLSDVNDDFLMLQLFDKDGSPLGAPQLLHEGMISSERAIDISRNRKGELAVVWNTGDDIWIQRCDSSGNPSGDAFLAHDSFPQGYRTYFQFPSVSLNDSGDVAVTWLEAISTGNWFPRFQVFDKENQSILPWNGEGHLLDTFYTLPGGQLGYDGTRLEVHWLDNQRFAAFWNAYWFEGYFNNFMGKVLSDKGLTKPPRQVLMRDNRAKYGGYYGWYSTDVCGERFVMGYDRGHYKRIDTITVIEWQHQAGFLGQVVDNEPQSTTAIFEVSPPLDKDTLQDTNPQPPAVACCDDRIVWVYSRLEPDTTWKAYFLVTDWDMVGVQEPPSTSLHDLEIANPIGREIVVRFWDRPEGFAASVFDVSGRRVDELKSPNQNGILIWGPHQNPGVYFIVPEESKANPAKVVLVR